MTEDVLDGALVAITDAPSNETVHTKSCVSLEELVEALDKDVQGKGVDMASGFVQKHPMFEPVIIRLMPGKAIPDECDKRHSIVGMVLSCEADTLVLTIGLGDQIRLKSFDDFVIQPGVHYSLLNTSSNKEALVKFLINL